MSVDFAFASLVQEYPCATAHLIYETLSKFATLVKFLDSVGQLGRVPFLLPECMRSMRRVFDELLTPEQSRIAKLSFTWSDKQLVSSTMGIYHVGYVGRFQTPFEQQVWHLRSGGSKPVARNTLGWCPSCEAMRLALHRAHPQRHNQMRCKILVLQRQGTARSIANLPQVLAALQADFPMYNVSSFEITAERSPMRAMEDAAVFLAPHGAGLSNVYFLPRKAIVVEFAYYGDNKGMPFPQNYYNMWSHGCNLTHTLALARGSYSSRMTVDLANMQEVLLQATQQSPRHTAMCGSSRQQSHVKHTEHPVVADGMYSAGVRM